ncbi:MAG: hypothetical protein IPL46_31995 [Saprospiraceae bacterium]|nr:hypothetical protein [Saprospiraceae bacterium]
MNLTSTRTILQCILAFVIVFNLAQLSNASEMGANPYQCPEEHVYIYCGELHSNYDYYGYPKAAYGYGNEITIYGPYTDEYLDDCGRGKIIRKWKIKYHYDWYWCEQTIHISDPYGKTFDGYKDVHWPKDYDLKDCKGSMHPDHMPYGYNWPEFSHHGCAKLGLRYEDKIHPYTIYQHGDHGYGYGSHYHSPCKVIYRTWELIDWCQYNGHSSYGGHYSGKWTYIQKIFVYDDIAPEITFCPDDIEVSGGDCHGNKVHVEIPKLQAKDDCGDVYYSYTRKHLVEDGYHSSYSGSGVSYGGNNASGYYEPGKTLVTFKAFDICGNTTECDLVVNVVAVDKKPPTVIGISSLTAVLMMTDTNQGMVELWPAEFNSSSYDNCTAREDLKFRLEPSVFTCENFGSNQVKFIVEDEAGNSDFIWVEVVVQANSFGCMGGDISGNVLSDQGNAIQDVEVTLVGTQMKTTDKNGAFKFTDILLGRTLSVTPFKNSDAMEGVDMYDYTLLSLHVDGIKLLKDPRKLIAADIDGNQRIDYEDLLALQRLIFGIDQKMEYNTSWKFYKQGFIFPDTIDPLLVKMPGSFEVTAYNGEEMNIQFEGIKIGDLGTLVREANTAGDIVQENNLIVQDVILDAGDEVRVPLTLENSVSANVISFALDFDPIAMEVLHVDAKSLQDRGSLTTIDPTGKGKALVANWFSITEENFKSGDVILELVVRAKQPLALSKAIKLTSTFNEAKIEGTNSGKSTVKLIYQNDLQNQLMLYQNSPNPFHDITTVGFYLPTSGEAVITIRDINGRQVLSRRGIYDRGYQELTLTRNDLPTSGLLFYDIESSGVKQTKKMLILN